MKSALIGTFPCVRLVVIPCILCIYMQTAESYKPSRLQAPNLATGTDISMTSPTLILFQTYNKLSMTFNTPAFERPAQQLSMYDTVSKESEITEKSTATFTVRRWGKELLDDRLLSTKRQKGASA